MRAGAWRGEVRLHSEGRQIPRTRGMTCKEKLRRSHSKREGVSERKSFAGKSGILVLLQVWPNLKWERRLGDEEPAHKMTGRNESG